MVKAAVYPSILACDMTRLGEECRRAESAGADGLHLDIMDGQFVNNISMGFDIIRAVRGLVKIPLSVHLMIIRPDWYVERCAEFGADTILTHVEAQGDVGETLRVIRRAGAKAGLTLNPATPVAAIREWLPDLDEVLCMSVNPGFGGQPFIPEVLAKVEDLRRQRPDMNISIDGGINADTAEQAAQRGANIYEVGTFLFRAADMAGEISRMRARGAAAQAAAGWGA